MRKITRKTLVCLVTVAMLFSIFSVYPAMNAEDLVLQSENNITIYDENGITIE